MMWHERKYRTIAARVLREHQEEFAELLDSDVRIAYLASDWEKVSNRKTVYGECNKVDAKYKWCCPYDFFIVIYEPNIADFTAEQIETLIRHELHHVGIEYTDSGLKYYIVPHDVEEFYEIIRDRGIDWSDTCAERR